MENTKNDLSFDKASIDFKAMLQTSAYAVRELTEQVSRYLNEIRETSISNNMTTLWFNANRLKEVSQNLAVASETYATLKEAIDRSELEIVNKD